MIYRVMWILGLLLMSGLATSAQEAETSTATPPVLEGTLWQLATYANADGEMVEAQAETTLELSNGEFGGNAGCNRYGGSYTLDGTTLELGNAVSTLMACADEAVMAQETAYLPALANVASYAIVDDQLQLLDADDNVLMTFSAGVAERRNGESREDTIARADAAMYQAKRAGKNRVLAAE